MKKNDITFLDVKQALRDGKFREKLPEILIKDVQKFLANPSCTCNFPIYEKVLKEAKHVLEEYYPEKNYKPLSETLDKLARNNWTIINCSIGELETRMKSLSPGRKQIAISRYEDQVTVVVNELEILF